MKKSKIIKLVLVSVSLTGCHHTHEQEKKVYLRSDTSARYSPAESRSHSGGYYHFYPYGIWGLSGYHRAGYYSGGIHESSNIGHSSFKSATVRGGFGSSTFHVSS